MTVTEITEINKSRAKIRTDEDISFVLYKGELRTYRIQEGKEITETVYQEIMGELLPKRAKKRVLNLLKNRSYTSAQLKDKLELGGYPHQIAQEAIAYAASYGYVNDNQYALDFIEYNKETKSRTRIFTDLLRKGIPERIIKEAWDEVVGDERQELEKEQIMRWINKKNFLPETASLQEKQKMMAFLYRKGFSIESIRSAVSLDITSICV